MAIIVLFISLLILYNYFYCSRFYSIYLLYHFAGMRVLFFKLFAIYLLNILEYMNRQQHPVKTALIYCRDAQADLGLRCPHMQKEPFSHDMALS